MTLLMYIQNSNIGEIGRKYRLPGTWGQWPWLGPQERENWMFNDLHGCWKFACFFWHVFLNHEVEKDGFCRQILEARMMDTCLPTCNLFEDVCSYVPSGDALYAEALSAGWPCQAQALDTGHCWQPALIMPVLFFFKRLVCGFSLWDIHWGYLSRGLSARHERSTQWISQAHFSDCRWIATLVRVLTQPHLISHPGRLVNVRVVKEPRFMSHQTKYQVGFALKCELLNSGKSYC